MSMTAQKALDEFVVGWLKNEMLRAVPVEEYVFVAMWGTPKKPISFEEFDQMWGSLTVWEREYILDEVSPLPRWSSMTDYEKTHLRASIVGGIPYY